jgi:probable phosphomutase (TIGR03848 family)
MLRPVTTVFLIRHGLTEHTGTRLYGRTAGIHLSDLGIAQAESLVERFRGVRLTAIEASPLERCIETATPLATAQGLPVRTRDDLIEMDAGSWTNRTLAGLSRTKLWRRIQQVPSQVAFPGGEPFASANARLVLALSEVAARHPRGRVALVTHSDPIRMLIAHVAGAHLDLFQRIVVDTASVSVVALGEGAPRLLLTNDTDGSLARFGPAARRRSGPHRT